MSSSILGYMHGTSDAEQQRLSRLNLSLNERCLREIGLVPGERVIDFGCGLGQLTAEIAEAVGPSGQVVAFDASPQQLDRARATLGTSLKRLDYRLGDIAKPPLQDDEWGSFDVAHARFFIEHLIDPLEAVRKMVRAVRPGGRVVLVDDDHAALRLWPEPPAFGSLWESYQLVIARNQNDPFVGRRLAAILHEAGARPTRASGVFYGGVGATPAMESVIENVIGLFEGVKDTLLMVSGMKRQHYEVALADFRTWGRSPASGFWYMFHVAEGVRSDR